MTEEKRGHPDKITEKRGHLYFFVPKVGDEKEVAKLGMEDSPVLGRQLVCSFC
jgi:hypothetical protein